MSNAKKYQRWVNKVINGLVSLGLEIEEDRKNKHRVVKGKIEGKPYRQTFSNTPKSYTSAMRNILRETRQKLSECGVNLANFKSSMPNLGFLTTEIIEKQKRDQSYKVFLSFLIEIEKEIDIKD